MIWFDMIMIWYDNDMIWCDYIYIYMYAWALKLNSKAQFSSRSWHHDGLIRPRKDDREWLTWETLAAINKYHGGDGYLMSLYLYHPFMVILGMVYEIGFTKHWAIQTTKHLQMNSPQTKHPSSGTSELPKHSLVMHWGPTGGPLHQPRTPTKWRIRSASSLGFFAMGPGQLPMMFQWSAIHWVMAWEQISSSCDTFGLAIFTSTKGCLSYIEKLPAATAGDFHAELTRQKTPTSTVFPTIPKACI